MSLDDIKLSPIVVQNLFQKTLISSLKQPKESAILPITLEFLGGNDLNIVIIVNRFAVTFLPDNDLIFLTDILKACKLNLSDIAIVNIFQNQTITYKSISTDLNAKVILLFGVSPSEIDLPFTIPDFQIQSFNNQKYIGVPDLSILQYDVELKKKLWTSLKKIFL